MGTKSVYQDAMNEKLNLSVHSGFSAGTNKIGMLMKSMDRGAMFSRHALD